MAPIPAPSLHLYYAAGVLDSRITATRTSTAWYVDNAGDIVSAASGVARFTHDPTTLRRLGLLTERIISNLVWYSKEFQTDWAIQSTRTANAGTAPDGTNTAVKMTAIATQWLAHFQQTKATITSSTVYTASCFFKKQNHRYVGIRFNTSTIGGGEAIPFYDFDTDTINNNSISNATLRREFYKNGWVRLAMTYTTTSTSNTIQVWMTDSAGQTGWTPAGTEEVYVWGCQLEQSTSVTSYIMNETGASLQRDDDSVSMPSGGWFNPAEGTLFIKLHHDGNFIPGFAGYTSIGDGTAANYVNVQGSATSATATCISDSVDVSPANNTVTNTSPRIVAMSYRQGARYQTGTKLAGGAVGPSPVTESAVGGFTPLRGVTTAYLNGQFNGTSRPNCTMERFVYWKKALSPSQLQRMLMRYL